MNLWRIAIVFLLAAGLLLSTARYFRSRLKLPAKILLTLLRTGWVVGIALAFIEPVIRFERFESSRMKIPVLVDVSASMRNFSPETSVNPFIDTLASLQLKTNRRVSFEYFLFGDSTRVRQPNQSAPILFNDTKSFFPSVLDENGGKLSGDMILVTDGQWTRPRRSGEVFPRNSIRYLTLPEAKPNPFVTVSNDAPETAPNDSSFNVRVTANGYATEKGVLSISLKENGKTVKSGNIDIDNGYFTQTITFKTSNSRPGRKLYTVEASVGGDIPPSVSSFVHQTVPRFFTYSTYAAKPTLDRRYVTQALQSSDAFKEKAASPDILFLFDWDSTAVKLLRGLPRHAVAVFSGAAPCSSSRMAEPPVTVKAVDRNILTNTRLDLRSMPPPQELIICKQPPVAAMKRMLTASVNTMGGRINTNNAVNTANTSNTVNKVNTAKTNDNRPADIPILFSGRFMGTQSLFCAVRGIWRWDFWPMASDRAESELFSFSNILLSAAKELLLDNISDQLILYPAGTLTETDSARFLMSLPAAVPIFEPVNLSLQIKNDGTVIDTAVTYRPNGLNKQPLSLPTMPPGRYAISATLTAPGVKAAFRDSFTVNVDMSELSVLSQNTQYLQEFAQPLDITDSVATNAVFDSWERRSAEKNTVTETVRINRSWLLLLIILALLAAELVLRRARGVD
ncbi:MAG: hypothetical protein LBB74_07070 [Chitinispirillales bacterium]|jgi:hypothetical protein|nr:hypothetical protein [Chitinispirillales bacterium]